MILRHEERTLPEYKKPNGAIKYLLKLQAMIDQNVPVPWAYSYRIDDAVALLNKSSIYYPDYNAIIEWNCGEKI